LPAPEVTGVRHGLYRDDANLLLASRVVVDMTGLTDWTWFTLTSPDRLVFDLSPAVFGGGVGHLPVGDGLVRAVRWAAHPGERVRVVLDLTRPAAHRSFRLVDPPRLVIDVDRLEVTLYSHERARLEVLPLDEYLIGVLAAEVPPTFQAEALRAQAVAARTYTLRRLRTFGGRGCSVHPGADVCSDPAHCQGYSSPERLRDSWREDYDALRGRLAAAVSDTHNLFVAYGPRPAEAVYHSTCGGHTASSAEVWGQSLPYLEGVPCEYCRISPGYRETRRLSLAEARRRLMAEFFAVKETTASGRTRRAEVAGCSFTGSELRDRLGLASTLIESVSGDLAVTTRGSGHGVGLCQWGAEGQARLGRSYREILRYYYPGTDLRGVRFVSGAGGGAPGPGKPDSPSPEGPGEPQPVVVIDPGHGGVDPGAVGPRGTYEKDVNLAVSLAAAEALTGRVEVHLTRREDETVSLRRRTDLANEKKAVLFLSVHANGSVRPEAGGTETYHFPGSRLGGLLARAVQRRLLEALRRRDRGVKEADFFVLRETICPAALAEVLFLTNPEEEALLRDPRVQGKVGRALAAAVLDYLAEVR